MRYRLGGPTHLGRSLHRRGGLDLPVRQAGFQHALAVGEADVDRLVFLGDELGAQPAEDVVDDGLGHRNLRVAGPAGGLEADVLELVHIGLEGDAVLEGDGDGQGEAVHHAGEGRAFLGHGDENLARLPVRVEPDGDVALVAGDGELVGDGLAGGRQLAPIEGPGDPRGRSPGAEGGFHLDFLGGKGLDPLGGVAVDGDGLQPQAPGLEVGLHNLFHRSLLRHVDRLGDGPADEGLHGGHHLEVAAVSDGAGAAGRLERAIEDGQVLLLQVRGGLDGAGAVNVVDDVADLAGGVAQPLQGHGHGVVDDLDHAPAHQPLVLHQGQVGLDAGGVAVHHEGDGARGGDDRSLGVAVAVLLALGQGAVPGVLGGGQQRRGNVPRVDAAEGVAVHGDDAQHRVAVGGGAGEGPGDLGDAGAGQVGLAGEQGGDGAGEVAALVRVVGAAGGHQQGAQVGVAEAEGPEVVGIAGDLLGGVAGVVNDDLHGGDHEVDPVPEALPVEVPRPVHELHQVEGGQVAGRVVQEHIFGAGVGGVDAPAGLGGVPAVDGGVVLHAGVAALVGGPGHAAEEVAGAVFAQGLAGGDRAGPPGAVLGGGLHEVVGDADGVVGVLEEDGAVGLAVQGVVVADLDQGPRLALLPGLAVDERFDVGVVHVQDDHLGGPAGLAARLDDPGEGVEALHKADRAAGGAAARQRLHGAAQGGEVGAGARAPLEKHPLGLGQPHDGLHRILDGVDEAGRALGLGLHAHVEPDGGVEGHHLVEEHMGELGAEGFPVVGRGEVAPLLAPEGQGVGHPADELPDAGFPLGGAALAVEVLGGDDVGGGLRPVLGDLDVPLLEDDLALLVGDGGGAPLPLHPLVGRSRTFGTCLGEAALELKPGLCLCAAGKDFPLAHCFRSSDP